ncbi:hypothetical protein [Desulfovibrio sp. Huiquan2017]|uniref:hypothetical protein n=1 Tax=Desulfovibrio sp. Huiquan2017 TaxID=2816861 RepID=UPI001A92AD6A|nr:hypothetical protein [Desulfovibrio sp. Huiquan2017]
MKIDMGNYEVWFVTNIGSQLDRAQDFYDFLTNDGMTTAEGEVYGRILITDSDQTPLANLLKTPPFVNGKSRHGISFTRSTIQSQIPAEFYTCAREGRPAIDPEDIQIILCAIHKGSLAGYTP